MSDQAHGQALYGVQRPEDVSWYRPHLDRSLQFIDRAQHHTPWGSEQEFVYCYCRLEP